MARPLRITAGSVAPAAPDATLDGSPPAAAVWRALPLEVPAQAGGDEIYFPVPVTRSLDRGREAVERGDLGDWPPGQAFCLFFGTTPASRGNEVRPGSPVNVFGRRLGDPTIFRTVRAGIRVRLERIDGDPGARRTA